MITTSFSALVLLSLQIPGLGFLAGPSLLYLYYVSTLELPTITVVPQ